MSGHGDISDWLGDNAYAHRGLHDENLPENSLGAFRAAMEAGLGLECDLRRSADGRAIVYSDTDLDRLTGRSGPVLARTVGELTKITLGRSEETIATLVDLLDLVKGQAPLLMELKTDADRSVGPLCKAVRRDLEGYRGQLAVMSFDLRVVRWFVEKLPAVPCGLVVSEQGARTLLGAFKQRRMIAGSGAEFIAYDIRNLPSAHVTRLAKRGMPLACWTIRNAAQLDTALEAGCAPIVEGAGVAAWQARF